MIVPTSVRIARVSFKLHTKEILEFLPAWQTRIEVTRMKLLSQGKK